MFMLEYTDNIDIDDILLLLTEPELEHKTRDNCDGNGGWMRLDKYVILS